MNKARIKRFRKDMRRFERIVSNQLKTCCSGVTLAQCHALLEIDQIGTATVQALSERLELNKSTLSRTVGGLVKKGAVKRLIDSDDRRVSPLVLTDLGKSICARINSEADLFYGLALDRIEAGRLETVLEDFGILVGAIEETKKPADFPSSCGCCTRRGAGSKKKGSAESR